MGLSLGAVVLRRSCSFAHSPAPLENLRSKTPEGINLEPLLSLELDSTFQKIPPPRRDSLAEALAAVQTESPGKRLIPVIIVPGGEDGQHKIYRSINLYQCETPEMALREYTATKASITRYTDLRLYRETETQTYRYFIFYALPFIDTNHGLPVGYCAYPDIDVGVLKGSLFILVSYTAYTNDNVDYISTLNQDVVYTRDLLANSKK